MPENPTGGPDHRAGRWPLRAGFRPGLAAALYASEQPIAALELRDVDYATWTAGSEWFRTAKP